MLQTELQPVVGFEVVNLLDDWDALRADWDQYVDEHPKGSVFHTTDMICVYRNAKGHVPLALAAVRPDGQIIALMMAVRVQTLPDPLGRLSSRSIMFAEPLCDDDPAGIAALAQLIAMHDKLMRNKVLFSEVRPLFASGAERTVLEGCGYEYMEYLNHLVDLNKPVDSLWNDLHRSARRAIRICERHGFEVHEVRHDNVVDEFYSLLQQSFEYNRVPLVDRSLFDAAVAEFQRRDMIKFFATLCDGKPIAMDAMLVYKDRIYFWYGGVQRLRNISPCSILRWRVLVWGQEHGYAISDSGGAGWPGKPYGVRDFKVKFGGQLVQYGRYRKVYSKWKLAMAERGYEFARKLLGKM